MNKIYKLVWSKVRNTWVVASEIAKGHGKSSSSEGNLKLLKSLVLTALLGSFMTAGISPVVAALTPDQQAVYDAVLQKLETEKKIVHYFSVDSADKDADSNWNNDGAKGQNAVAIGVGAKAQGVHSMALGNLVYAQGESATAVGEQACAKAKDSTAVGFIAKAQADSATAVGTDAQAQEDSATALGASSQAQNVGTTALGFVAIAQGEDSTAVGCEAQALGFASLALGWRA